jgi:hypothetical protein
MEIEGEGDENGNMATYFGGRFKGNMNDYHIKNVQNE